MAQNLILVAIVLFLCLMAEKLSGKVGMPALILFMGVGMLFGSDGILRIAFDDVYSGLREDDIERGK